MSLLETRILKAVESDFYDQCGHIFEWDPSWDNSVLELHCPECLERARTLASRIAAIVEQPHGAADRRLRPTVKRAGTDRGTRKAEDG